MSTKYDEKISLPEFMMMKDEIIDIKNRLLAFKTNFIDFLKHIISMNGLETYIKKYNDILIHMISERRSLQKKINTLDEDTSSKITFDINSKYKKEIADLHRHFYVDFILELINRSPFRETNSEIKKNIVRYEKEPFSSGRYNVKITNHFLFEKLELLNKLCLETMTDDITIINFIKEHKDYEVFIKDNFTPIIDLLTGTNLELFYDVVKTLLYDCSDSFYVISNILPELIKNQKILEKRKQYMDMIIFHEGQIIQIMISIVNIIIQNNENFNLTEEEINTLKKHINNKLVYVIEFWNIMKKIVVDIISKFTVDTTKMTPEEKTFYEKCKNYSFIPSVHKAVDRIIAIGDLHGDYEVVIKTLRLARVIFVEEDGTVKWIGGKTYVVQTGDQLDMGGRGELNDDRNDDIKILRLFTDLHQQALRVGGAVISLFGNHELMNVVGVFDFVSPRGIDGFQKTESDGLLIRKNKFKRGSKYSEFLGCTRLSMVLIGTNLFVHAGIKNDFIKKIGSGNIDEINDIIRKWVLNILKNPDEINNIYQNVLPTDSESSIFWTRYLSLNSDNKTCQTMTKSMQFVQFKNIIVGHTIQENGINKIECADNKIVRIDVGLSKIFNTMKVEILEILHDNEFNVLSMEGERFASRKL